MISLAIPTAIGDPGDQIEVYLSAAVLNWATDDAVLKAILLACFHPGVTGRQRRSSDRGTSAGAPGNIHEQKCELYPIVFRNFARVGSVSSEDHLVGDK